MPSKDTAKVIEFPSIDEMRKSVDQLTKDLEEGVQDLGRRAAKALPEERRKQVDEVIDRLGSVRGNVEESITTLRARSGKQTGEFFTGIESDLKGYVEALFKRFKLPVRSDLNSLKRRLTAIERRLDTVEKARNAA